MKRIILLVIIVFTSPLTAQYQQWLKTFNGSQNGNDVANLICADNAGNVIVSGRTLSTGNNTDFATIKYSAAGMQLWAAVFDGAAHAYDEPHGLGVDLSGNIFVAGMTRNASLNYDICVIKYSPSGSVLWQQLWAGATNLNDVPNDLYVDAAGNVYVTGSTELTSNNNYNYITLKYDPSGVIQWQKQYNHPQNKADVAMFIDGNGTDVYVTGNSNAPGSLTDYLTIKYNSTGDSLWVARFNNTSATNEIPYGFAVDAQGNALIAGLTQRAATGIDYVTVKYNTNGTEQWHTFYSSPGNSQDEPTGLALDGSGNVYVTGKTRINSGYNDYGTVKYNSAGVEQWVRLYNSGFDRDDNPAAICTDNMGNVYVTGSSSQEVFDIDGYTIKYDPSGNQLWSVRFDSTTDDEVYAMTVDGSNNVIIAGYIGFNPTDYSVLKYSQVNAVTHISGEIPGEFKLSQNYPNPFNPLTKIRFSLAKAGPVNLTVYDIHGRVITVLVKDNLEAGRYEADFDGAELASGIYFCTFNAGGTTQTKRLILLK